MKDHGAEEEMGDAKKLVNKAQEVFANGLAEQVMSQLRSAIGVGN